MSGLATAAEAPVAVAPGPVTTDEDLAVQITLSGTDDDGDELTFSISSVPVNGTVLPPDPGQCTPVPPDPCDVTVTYTPVGDFHGSDSFAFTVADGVDGTSSPATVTITVNPVNDPPVAVDDAKTVQQNAGPTLLTVLANDTALPDTGETLSIVAVTQGANGLVAITGGGTGVMYDPAGSFTGADTFTYTISDGALEATASVHVNVAPDITPPVTSIRVVGAAAATSSSIRVTVRWSAFELQSGVARYQLQQRIDGGAWTTIPLSPVNATSIERVLAGGHDYAFRVRAFDGIGNQGAYATSRTLRL